MLGWRDTPIDGDSDRPRGARLAAVHSSRFSSARPQGMDQRRIRAQALRRSQARGERDCCVGANTDKEFFYIPSLSSRTIVYKGLLLAPQIANFYPELRIRT